jgi:ArpU family phage transcriptional regulator
MANLPKEALLMIQAKQAETTKKQQQQKKKSEARKKAEKIMRKYKMLDAIIESKQIDVDSFKLTQSFDVSEAQRTNNFHSEPETLAIIRVELQLLKNRKTQLKNVFDNLKRVQQIIWERRYLDEEKDVIIIGELEKAFYMNDKKYYRLKKEMIDDVIEALSLDVN